MQKQSNNLYNEFLDEWSEKWFQYILNKYGMQSYHYDMLSCSPDITWKTVEENSDKPWNYDALSMNPNITWEIVQANPNKPWNYRNLSLNLNITRKITSANPDKPWNYTYLNMRLDAIKGIVYADPDEHWYYCEMERTQMICQKNNYIRKRFQEWFKRSELKEELMAKVWHPRNFEKFKYLDPETFGEDF